MKNDWVDKLLMSKWFYVVITILFIGVFAFIFKWQHFCYWFDEKYQVNHELLGTFGDFIGGVLGTLFVMVSIILLIRTFNQQRHVTTENKELADTQRFNDMFFELLRLYQEQIKELRCNEVCEEIDSDGEKCTCRYNRIGKDFFDIKKLALQNKFENQTSFEGNQTIATSMYMSFYIDNKSKLSICYRTLFCIYDLIDKSEGITADSKKNYLKIIRAQLTESELFFLRYNAMSFYGSKFINYLNKYNVLKHLPIFELLEFKDWWKHLDDEERVGINIVIYRLRQVISDNINNSINNIIRLSPYSEKYKLGIVIYGAFDIKVLFAINGTENDTSKEYVGFEKLTPKRIQALFDCVLKEFFLYSNFEEFNKLENIEFYSDKIKKIQGVDIITSGLKSKNGVPLVLKYNHA